MDFKLDIRKIAVTILNAQFFLLELLVKVIFGILIAIAMQSIFERWD